jgi:flagellar motor switch protein FliM
MSVGVITSTSSAVFSQASNSPEVFLLVGLRLELAESTPLDATLCIPLSVLLPLLDALDRLDSEGADGFDSGADEVLERLLEAPLEVAVSFPEIALSPEELLSLAVGDVIPLQRPEGLPLRLAVSGVHLCEVVPTTRGKRLACLVVESNPTEDY